MLSTVYAQKVLGSDPPIKFAADVLNGHVEGPEDPHGVGWVEGGIPGIIECDCYIMEGDKE